MRPRCHWARAKVKVRLRVRLRVRVSIAGPPPTAALPSALDPTRPQTPPCLAVAPSPSLSFCTPLALPHLPRRFPLTTFLAPHSQRERVRQPPAEGEHATSHACLLCGRRAAQGYGGAIFASSSSHVTVVGQSTLSGNRAEVYAAGLGLEGEG